MRAAPLLVIALGAVVLLGMGGCGSVGKARTDAGKDTAQDKSSAGDGNPPTDTAGGTGGAGGGSGAGGDNGGGGAGGAGAGGTGGATTIRVKGGLEAIGPSPGDAVRIIRAGLTFPRTRICNGTVCVSGGIAP